MNGSCVLTLCNQEMNDVSLLKIAERVGHTITTQPITGRYHVQEEIGRGKYAVVKRVVAKDTGEQFAAKFIKKRRRGKCCRAEIMHEVAILDVALSNPWIVHMKEVYETNHDVIVVMEYAAGGELYHHCVIEESLSEQDTRLIIKQTLHALQFLHDRNIVHLDIKPSNILLMKEISTGLMDVKLCDFSFARLIDSSADIREILGTPDYVSPEILSYEPIHTSADIWSVGVLTYVMLTGHSPFMGETKQETFLNISQLNYEFPDDLFADISQEAQAFIRSLLIQEPEDRPTVTQSLQHPWLRDVNLTSLSHAPNSDVISVSMMDTSSASESHPLDKLATTGDVAKSDDVTPATHDDVIRRDDINTTSRDDDVTPPVQSSRRHCSSGDILQDEQTTGPGGPSQSKKYKYTIAPAQTPRMATLNLKVSPPLPPKPAFLKQRPITPTLHTDVSS